VTLPAALEARANAEVVCRSAATSSDLAAELAAGAVCAAIALICSGASLVGEVHAPLMAFRSLSAEANIDKWGMGNL
jgi:hypothetical protein